MKTAILPLAIGSLAGGLARYGMSVGVGRALGSSFPYGTLSVNLAGCFLIGFFHALAKQRLMLSPETVLLLIVGFCGAFTTFSTLILEISNLIDAKESAKAALYAGTSLVLGFILLRGGAAAARFF